VREAILERFGMAQGEVVRFWWLSGLFCGFWIIIADYLPLGDRPNTHDSTTLYV